MLPYAKGFQKNLARNALTPETGKILYGGNHQRKNKKELKDREWMEHLAFGDRSLW